ncbi:aldo/keto reductase [Halotalea alkalilenta]|uniref:aldo/keto reductase n=1 Tax=Halotalea alkalilenta TaxID=376489 RepID=UPI000693680C|nr:aldo/keto reductase [Halotalea alkalilenta]
MTATLDFAGVRLPAIGQGTWHMGEGLYSQEEEVEALRRGLDLGLKLIDTAEMYADGRAEEIVGRALAGRRDEAYLVSKALPSHAGRDAVVRACERSLARLGTDRLDLYLLHWRGGTSLEETLEGFERLVEDGKILRYGVSNFDVDDIDELAALPGGERCATNQVLYHLGSRGIEYALLPRMRELKMPTMAYCPVAQGGVSSRALREHPEVKAIAGARGISPTQLLLAWTIRPRDGLRDILAIPKAVQPSHLAENAQSLEIELSEAELARLDRAFTPPQRKEPLDIV